MPDKTIGTKIKLEGEKKFREALRDAQRELRVMNSDLKAAAAEFEFTGDKQAFLTSKSQILRDEIAKQDKIVADLTGMLEKSKKAYGDASAKTDGYRIKLSNATATLFKMKQQLAETDREAEELGRDSTRVGRQIKDGIGDAAEETSESLDDMIKKLSSDIGDIKGSTSFTAISAGANFVTGSIGKIVDFVESSRDYRNKHALATNAIEKNLNASEEEINDLYLKIVGVTGESNGAFEALTTLSKTGAASFTELNNMLDLILGAYVQFGEEAKVEDVAESLQESVATGTLTGKIAEVYERLGVDIEVLNSAIQDLPPRERLQALMDAFAGTEVAQSYRNYVNDNQDLVELNKKAAELESAKSKLAEELTGVSTFYYDSVIAFVNKTTEFIKKLKEALKIFSSPEDAAKQLKEYNQDFASALESGQLDTFGGVFNFVMDQSQKPGKETINKSIAPDLFSSNPKLFEEKGGEAGEAYIDGFNDTVENSDVNQALEFMRNRLGDEGLQVEDILQKNELQKQMTEQLGNMGSDAGAELDKKLTEKMIAAANNANISGSNVGTSLKNGLDSTMPLAVASAQSYAAQISAAYANLGAGLNTTVVYPRVPGQPTAGGTTATGSGNFTASFMVNDKEFARAVLPAINKLQGRSVTRMKTV